MDEFIAQLIASVAEARAKREEARNGQPPGGRRQRPSSQPAPGSAAVPPTLRTATGQAGPTVRADRPAQIAPRPGAPVATALRATPRAATAISAIESADPFAAVAAAAQTEVPSASSLLAAFANRDGLLAGIVLSETLAPPLALRPERDR